MENSYPNYFHLYPLTSLQIGLLENRIHKWDTKTNPWQVFLYFASDSNKFLIIIHGQYGKNKEHSTSTQEEISTHTRSEQRSSSFNWSTNRVDNHDNALDNFLVFEVCWNDVRGIDYLNKLQTDGSISLEVKSLNKWEFNSIDQALSSKVSWLKDSNLRISLNKLQKKISISSHEFRHNNDDTNRTSHEILENESVEPEFKPMVYEEISVSSHEFRHNDDVTKDESVEPELHERNVKESNDDAKPKAYKDILVICNFNNRDIPFKLKPIIMFDPRLLTLLELGLPFWAIYLQSSPLFCLLYRYWMRPLFTSCSILISLSTFVIGFYDLYKNIPLLKSTISRLCGPLFKWIESWDMISRIKYLGTMLFLQNLQKAMKPLIMMAQWIKPLVLLITETLSSLFRITTKHLQPLCSLLCHIAYEASEFLLTSLDYLYHASTFMCTVFLAVVGFSGTVVRNLYQFFTRLFELVYPNLSFLVILVRLIFSSIWEYVQFCAQHCTVMASCFGSMFYDTFKELVNCFTFVIRSIDELDYLFPSNWEDLLSKVVAYVQYNIYQYLRPTNKDCSCNQGAQFERLNGVDDKEECEHCR